jgi:hypothetical protein
LSGYWGPRRNSVVWKLQFSEQLPLENEEPRRFFKNLKKNGHIFLFINKAENQVSFYDAPKAARLKNASEK